MVTPHEALRTLRALKPFLAYKIFQALKTKIKIRFSLTMTYVVDMAHVCVKKIREDSSLPIQRYHFFQNLGHVFDIYRGHALDTDLDSIVTCNPDHDVGCNLEHVC